MGRAYLCYIRKIIHIDMDAFFASVEQRDFPELKGKPVAVGGSRERGVVAAASYEARKFGVRSAMSSKMAYLKCPDIIFQRARFNVYKEVSNQVRAIFREYTDLIEPLSLDEAYLDVTENKKGITSATIIANEIRAKILEVTKLTASAGISSNKFVAKMASDVNKPNGYCVIPPDQIQEFLNRQEVRRFFGIGKVAAAKLHKMGVIYGKDLTRISLDDLKRHFGNLGEHFFNIARGKDNRKVNPNRERKSLGAESTFENDLYERDQLMDEVQRIGGRVWKRFSSFKKQARTVVLKVKFNDFNQITRSYTLEDGSIEGLEQLLEIGKTLLRGIDDERGVRLLGLTLTNFKAEDKQDVQLTLNF